MKHWTDFLVNLMEEFAIKFVHQLHFSAILINSKFHFLKTVNGHFVCRHRGLYTGIQDGIQAYTTVYSHKGRYTVIQDGIQDGIQSYRTVYSHTGRYTGIQDGIQAYRKV